MWYELTNVFYTLTQNVPLAAIQSASGLDQAELSKCLATLVDCTMVIFDKEKGIVGNHGDILSGAAEPIKLGRRQTGDI